MQLLLSLAAGSTRRCTWAFISRSSSLIGRRALVATSVTSNVSLLASRTNIHTYSPDLVALRRHQFPFSSSRFMATVAEEKADIQNKNVVQELPTNESDVDLLKIRHSSAHVMAMAVQQIFPEAQVTIGPWIDNGFYYDFYFPETTDKETGEVIPSRKLTDNDLQQIKKAMDKIMSQDYPITREEVSREEARRRIEAIGEPFKLEILDSIKTEPITIYHIGDKWWDLCAGPHVESTGMIPKKAVSLLHIAGAYWRGDENREMLQRIYATAWKDVDQLKAYKKMVEEAKRRDHRMLGKKLDLFSIQVTINLRNVFIYDFFDLAQVGFASCADN